MFNTDELDQIVPSVRQKVVKLEKQYKLQNLDYKKVDNDLTSLRAYVKRQMYYDEIGINKVNEIIAKPKRK
mgnify:CR=1 FL=1